ncbi:DUF4974 domain-containing protein [Fulvivirga sp. M361]|uniref:FecR family protein n=1 Tax=Fulvivirga sp. M361 TaxID=2594266 RepID=UPI00117B0FEE|nr:FecR family protein [Fulvivirga sp. M361]TRX61692.1 DUF4974 domain-containing protein [Fulvivirga sp. M361]
MKEHFDNIEDFILNPEFKSWVIEPTPESNEFWQIWLKNHPKQKETFLIAKELVQNIEFKEFKATDEVKDKVLNSVLRNSGSKNTPSNFRKHKAPGKLLFKIAASLVLIVSIYFLIESYNLTNTGSPVVVKSLIYKENPAGRKSQIFLPDGSMVWLNSASSIEYVANFSGDKRIVKLKGEAYFNVVKDGERPFIVESGEMSVTALGTAFNVKAFEEDNAAKVVLVEGKVKVERPTAQSKAQEAAFLDPGEFLLYNKRDKKSIKGKADINATMAWKNGVILFERASFTEVISKLERWYGVSFKIQNERKKGVWDYSSEFDNQSLDNVLKSLSYTKNFEYQIHKDTVKIKF